MAEDDLLALAAAVADGVPLDWEAAERAAQTPQDRDLIRELRHISTLTNLTRTLPDEVDRPLVGRATLDTGTRALPRWGQFVLVDKIGEGAQGEVFQAVDVRLQRDVALKLRRASAISPQQQDDFLSEARLLARVRHPNVVTIFGADVIDGRAGLWMELIKGENLDTLIRERGAMSGAEATLIGVSLCGALNAVHGAALLHRDLKSQNVMREAGGRYVLMDFGVGRELHVHDGRADGAGTPLYLAPEVLRGAAATVSSEIYALGVLLHYLVTGTYPFTAKTVHGLLAEHDRPRIGLRHQRSDLPVPFVAAVERALSADPRDRFSTAAEFSDALTASPGPTVASGPTPVTRRSWVFGLAVAAVLLVSGLWIGANRPVAIQPANTVAVLPFADLSGDQSAKYLAQGLTDLLTTGLGSRTDLRVLARTTVQEFVGSRRVLELAQQVGADRLVEGSVSPDGARLRVSIRIIHAGSGNTLWAGEMVGVLSALAVLEEEMVGTTGRQLGKDVSKAPDPHRWQAEAASLEDYFRGWGEYWRLSREGFTEAQRLFKAATARSPLFAEAHAAYAYARLTNELSNREPTYEDGIRAVEESADTAMRINPDSALGEATVGWKRFYVDWDWTGAEQHLRRAIELNPSDAQVRWMYAQMLMAENRPDAALAEAQLVQRLDPLNIARHSNVATVLYYSRRYDEAAKEVEKAVLRDPNAGYARFGMSRMLSALGRYDESLTWLRTAAHLNEPFVRAELVRQLLVSGHQQEASTALRTVELDYTAGRLAPDYLAFVRIAEGDHKGALALLEEAVRQRSGTVIWIHVDPRFDALRNNERFLNILRSLNLVRNVR